MQEERKMKLKKGWVVVQVGLEDEDGGGIFQRFSVPISYLYHPFFQSLLDKASEVYGYHTNGPLRLPCSAIDFLDLRWRVETETTATHGNHHHHHHQRRHQLRAS
ncbi:hypothetical protein ABFS82_12G041400 [Erythranthe guttata]|uniref:SAUR family protein n=1 Tax=Erythranthe guttata TaxID=4155 RepID=A0A022R6V8_ERYGU|nr:hypothetical protein MIMGU_mgv1a016860mg [Erythranthe guttata]